MKTLQECNWKEFAIGDYFTVTRPTSRKEDDYCEGRIIFVASGAVNNGVTKFCQPRENEVLDKGNCLTVSPVDGSCYYQDTDFLGRGGAGSSVIILYPKAFALNKHNALFISRCINQTASSKYSYGLMASKERIKKDRIILPTTPDNTPDWQFMEDYMREVESKLLAQAQPALQEKVNKYANLQLPTLNNRNWKEFAITDIFCISSGVRLTAANMHKGNTPFIGATDSNNGITAWVSNSNSSLDENVLGVNYNGSVCETFYHPYKCLFSDDVKRLHLKRQPADTMGKNSNDKYIYLFLKQIILQQKVKYAYGYKFKAKRMSKQIILLPTTPDNTPDWQFMEDYMRAVEAKQIAAYLQQKHLTKI